MSSRLIIDDEIETKSETIDATPQVVEVKGTFEPHAFLYDLTKLNMVAGDINLFNPLLSFAPLADLQKSDLLISDLLKINDFSLIKDFANILADKASKNGKTHVVLPCFIDSNKRLQVVFGEGKELLITFYQLLIKPLKELGLKIFIHFGKVLSTSNYSALALDLMALDLDGIIIQNTKLAHKLLLLDAHKIVLLEQAEGKYVVINDTTIKHLEEADFQKTYKSASPDKKDALNEEVNKTQQLFDRVLSDKDIVHDAPFSSEEEAAFYGRVSFSSANVQRLKTAAVHSLKSAKVMVITDFCDEEFEPEKLQEITDHYFEEQSFVYNMVTVLSKSNNQFRDDLEKCSVVIIAVKEEKERAILKVKAFTSHAFNKKAVDLIIISHPEEDLSKSVFHKKAIKDIKTSIVTTDSFHGVFAVINEGKYNFLTHNNEPIETGLMSNGLYIYRDLRCQGNEVCFNVENGEKQASETLLRLYLFEVTRGRDHEVVIGSYRLLLNPREETTVRVRLDEVLLEHLKFENVLQNLKNEQYGLMVLTKQGHVLGSRPKVREKIIKDKAKGRGKQGKIDALLDSLEEVTPLSNKELKTTFLEEEEKISLQTKTVVVSKTHEHPDTLNMADYASRAHTYIYDNGINVETNFIRELFAAMVGSRLIFSRQAGTGMNGQFVDLFTAFIGARSHYYKLSSGDTFTSLYDHGPSMLATFLQSAKRDPNKIHFVVFDEVKLNRFASSFEEVLDYVKTTDDSAQHRVNTLEENGKGPLIPPNVWFFVITNEEEYSGLPLQINGEGILLQPKAQLIEARETISENAIKLTYFTFIDNLRNARNKYFLDEVVWRKFDLLEDYLNRNSAYATNNRVIRMIERFSTLFLECNGDVEDLIDSILSTIILPTIHHYALIPLIPESDSFVDIVDRLFILSDLKQSQLRVSEIEKNNRHKENPNHE